MKKKVFRYANKKERLAILEAFPEIKKLKIDYNHKLNRKFNSIDKFILHNDFEQWIIRFSNKLSEIEFSYVQLMFSYENGIPDENWKRDKEEGGTIFFEHFNSDSLTSKYLFDFYTEAFYYHYFSSVDLLYKAFNKLLNLKIDDSNRYFNKLILKEIKKIDSSLYSAIKDFINSTKTNRNFRNSFVHSYAPNKIDLRSKKSVKNEKKTVTMMDPSYTTSKDILVEIKILIKHYLPLLLETQKRIKISDFLLITTDRDIT